MKHPGFLCSYCGSSNLRRSHSMSIVELPKMALGNYPFRCLDCRERFWINVWLFSKGKHVVCPRCLRVDVASAPPQRMRLGLWKRLLVAFGARGYRCSFCGHRFLSFKRSERPATGASVSATQEESRTGSDPVAPTTQSASKPA